MDHSLPTWADGILIEGENKYIQRIMDEWRLERRTSLGPPGCDEDKGQEGRYKKLDAESATVVRRSAVLNYMSEDRLALHQKGLPG